MPQSDPQKLRIIAYHLLERKICRKCGAVLSPNMKRCRRCHSDALRPKRKERKR